MKKIYFSMDSKQKENINNLVPVVLMISGLTILIGTLFTSPSKQSESNKTVNQEQVK